MSEAGTAKLMNDDEGVIFEVVRNGIYKAIEVYDDGEIILTIKKGNDKSEIIKLI